MDGVGEALSIRFNNLVYELQATGEDVIVLSLGEAFFELPLHSFDTLPRPELFHYSHSRGLPALRTRLAAHYRDAYGVVVDADSEILVTAGSKIAIHMSLMTLLSPGDEVVVPEPAWVSYTEQIRLCHGVPVTVPYDAGLDGIEARITERTRAIVVNSPNNPRGDVLSEAGWARLHALAERHDLFLLCDEAYSDFLPDGERFVSGGAGDAAKRHTLICNSTSKNLGMSGWRIGYVIARADVIDQVLKVNQHLVTCPATVLSLYVAEHFDDLLAVTRPQIRAVVAKRAEVARAAERLGIACLPGTATFYLFASIAPSELGSEAFCERLLRERHVSVVPGIGYGPTCDAFVRISIGTEPMDRTLAGLRAIRELVDETARTAA
jgi:aspartate aminotransferase/aminotransferase